MHEQHSQVVGVRFRPAGLIYQFDTGDLILEREDRVIVETDRGSAIGTVVVAPRPQGQASRGLHRVIKKADSRDLMREDQGLQKERSLYRNALDGIRASGLGLKLVKLELVADGTKALVFCAAEEKAETRDLAAALGRDLGIKVEIRQLGPRDEARLQGGVGVCGRELCCSSWLPEFQPVSVKMAKEQGLALNPSKLAGQCGRLKCCLKYEYQTYLDLRRDLPRIGSRVQSVQGDGQITRHNALRQTAMLRRDDDGVEVEVTLADLVEKRADA